MTQKFTVLVGRMVLQTAEIEIEAEGTHDEPLLVAKAAAAELKDHDFEDVYHANSRTTPFIIGIADHLSMMADNADDPPEKQQSLEKMVRDDLDSSLDDFAATAAIADINSGEGELIHAEWMGDPRQPDLMISDIATDWIDNLSGLTGPTKDLNELRRNPEAMRRHQEYMNEFFGDTIRENRSRKPPKSD